MAFSTAIPSEHSGVITSKSIRHQARLARILLLYHRLYKKSMLLWGRNCRLEGNYIRRLKSTNKKVDFSLLKGIDIFFLASKTEIWLPFTDTFLTNVPSYGSSKMARMRVLLDDAKNNEGLTISSVVEPEASITHPQK